MMLGFGSKAKMPRFVSGDIVFDEDSIGARSFYRVMDLGEYNRIFEEGALGWFSDGHIQDVMKRKAVCVMRYEGTIGILEVRYLTKASPDEAKRWIGEHYDSRIAKDKQEIDDLQNRIALRRKWVDNLPDARERELSFINGANPYESREP